MYTDYFTSPTHLLLVAGEEAAMSGKEVTVGFIGMAVGTESTLPVESTLSLALVCVPWIPLVFNASRAFGVLQVAVGDEPDIN